MKKFLLASTVLVAGAAAAHAEVTLSGDGRMGVVSTDGDLSFNSRARVKFSLAGETDGGLAFGGSFRADNAVGASSGTAGSVFISGAFGKLEMGDVDGAAQNATGHVAGVGYTGLGDLNESTFISAGAGTQDPTALYSYSSGAFTGYLSVTNPANAVGAQSIGAKYATDTFTVGLGYEDNGAGTKHTVVKGTTTFSGVSLQALYGKASGTISGAQFAVSAGYTVSGIAATAFYTDDLELGGAEAYGLGGSYDLGGGAAVAGGIVQNVTADTMNYDLGVTFSF